MDKLPARSMTFDEAFNRLVSEIQPTRTKVVEKFAEPQYHTIP